MSLAAIDGDVQDGVLWHARLRVQPGAGGLVPHAGVVAPATAAGYAVHRDAGTQPVDLTRLPGALDVTPEQARAIIAQRYTVPGEVRTRNNQRVRKERKERRIERKSKKRGKRSS